LDIVLIVEGHKYVLTEASPTDPSINVADAARQRFDR
jgi:mannose/fructose/N-acetylgalactosamine-specific phosphotransferase system component IID